MIASMKPLTYDLADEPDILICNNYIILYSPLQYIPVIIELRIAVTIAWKLQ